MKTRTNTMSSGPCRQVLECGSPLPLFAETGLPHPPQSARGLAHSKTLARDAQAAFTRLDLLCVLLALSLCAAVMLPALASSRPRSQRVMCANNLRQIGQAFHLWGSDHGERVPFAVALSEGGTQLHPLGINPWLHFSWMSNELNSAAILLCPSDTGRPARDFSADPNGGYLHPNYANAATSYALAHGGAGTRADWFGSAIISFDRNMGFDSTASCPYFAQVRFLAVTINSPSPALRWDGRLHAASGNILRLGGNVDQLSNAGLPGAFVVPADDNNGSKHFITPR